MLVILGARGAGSTIFLKNRLRAAEYKLCNKCVILVLLLYYIISLLFLIQSYTSDNRLFRSFLSTTSFLFGSSGFRMYLIAGLLCRYTTIPLYYYIASSLRRTTLRRRAAYLQVFYNAACLDRRAAYPTAPTGVNSVRIGYADST